MDQWIFGFSSFYILALAEGTPVAKKNTRTQLKKRHPTQATATKLYKKTGDILLTLKAYNGRCVLEWLSETIYTASRHEEYCAHDPDRVFLIAGALTLVFEPGAGHLFLC